MGNYFTSWAYNVPAAAERNQQLQEPTAVADAVPDDDDDDGMAASLGRVRRGHGTEPPPPTPRRTLPRPSDQSIQLYMTLAEPYAQITESKPTQNVAAVYRHWKEDDDVMDFYRDLRLMRMQVLRALGHLPSLPDDASDAFGRLSPFDEDSLVLNDPNNLDHCVVVTTPWNGQSDCIRPHLCDRLVRK